MMATDGRFHGDVEVRSMPVPHCQPNRDPCQEEEDQEQEKKEEKKESQRTVSAAANTAAALVKVEVDVIVPVHNASLTLREAVLSALRQRPRPRTTTTTTRNGRDEGSFDDGDPRQAGSASLPEARQQPEPELEIVVHVCCHDDGSTDDSWKVLQELLVEHLASRDLSNSTSASAATSDDAASSTAAPSPASDDDEWYWESHLLLSKSNDGVSRGAGYARNRAVELRPNLCARRLGNDGSDDNADGSIVDSTKQQQQPERHQFLCMLDSDDVMDECRIVEQVTHIMSLSPSEQQRCLLGCNFVRLPEGSTAHYTEWANSLNDERLGLERFREVTVLQPTWVRPVVFFVCCLRSTTHMTSRRGFSGLTHPSAYVWYFAGR